MRRVALLLVVAGKRYAGRSLCVVAAWVVLVMPCAGAEKVLVRLSGTDFKGGGAERFGSTNCGLSGVNYVYAEPTGPLAAMSATFELPRVPDGKMFLLLKARDDNADEVCSIEITLNGVSLFRGDSGFPQYQWEWQRLAIPKALLKAGRNEVAVFNREQVGKAGTIPWFMVAECHIVGEDTDAWGPSDIEKEFSVTLPKQRTPIPEPLTQAAAEPGFKIRGIKGWNWKPEQYLEEIPILARYKMNFLMNCYLSMFSTDDKARASGKPNRWWEPLPEAKKRAYERVVRSCQEHGVQFCFATHPSLFSSRSIDYTSKKDLDALWQHYEWMVGMGVNWFSICLDDISTGIDASGQARMVNEFLRRLRARNPKAEIIFCPTYYWGTGDDPKARAYLQILARELDPDVYVFWTGPQGVSGYITRDSAESYKSLVKHRLIIWDNYPVNNDRPTMHLGPLTGRDPELCRHADGYMSNPMCTQNQINRIPLLTCADYAYNPKAYDPARSIGQAILHLADSEEQREALKDLVEAYPGRILCGGGTRMNPVREQFKRLASQPHSRFIVGLYVRHLEGLSARLSQTFPDQFRAAKKTLDADLVWMKEAFATQYGE